MLEGVMLRWTSIFGGLLIMMGQHDRSEALFCYFRLQDQVPEHHLLRLIDKHISFEFVRHEHGRVAGRLEFELNASDRHLSSWLAEVQDPVALRAFNLLAVCCRRWRRLRSPPHSRRRPADACP